MGVKFEQEKDVRALCFSPMLNAYVGVNVYVVCLALIGWNLNGGLL